MKTISSLFLIGLVVLSPTTLSLAQDAQPANAKAGANATGKVLILDNERTLEGDIERIGEQYRIRRTVGETWVPDNRVLQLCADAEAGYQFLRGRANRNDPDEHLRLAQWCREHGLRDLALVEVKAAVDLRPNHAETRRLLAHLQQASQPNPKVPAATLEDPDPAPRLNVDLTAEAMGQFATRVQPILMNSCAGCHAGDRGGSFKLIRAYDNGSSRRTTQQNLAAVLNEVNLSQPLTSPFLSKALSVHGKMAQAPFKNRETPAYRALEEWVRQTAGGPGHPAEQSEVSSQKSVVRSREENKPPLDSTTPIPVPPVVREEFAGPPHPEAKTNPPPAASKPPEPADEWDGDNFNREMHPGRRKDPG